MNRYIPKRLAQIPVPLQALLTVGISSPSVPLTTPNGSLDHSPNALIQQLLAAVGVDFHNMAPIRDSSSSTDRGDNCTGIRSDRKKRKPLVEKKRRARINESLQELRFLIADAELQSKMENAEVLEMTVKRVESVLQLQTQEVDAVSREACERFAAGYIQCMHDVHTFVSTCPGVDQTVSAELLNHLMESMPMNDDERLRVMLPDRSVEYPGLNSAWSPAPSTDDLCSDLDETESEQSHVSCSEEADDHDVMNCSSFIHPKSMWRPW